MEVENKDTSRIETVTTSSSTAVGPVLYQEISIAGYKIKAIVDTGAQSTVISRQLLHKIVRHMKTEGQPIPKLEQPSARLYGRSGKDSKELNIISQIRLSISLDEHSVEIPVFIQSDSEISCLLGMNALLPLDYNWYVLQEF